MRVSAVVLAGFLLLSACGDSTEPRVPTILALDQSSVSLEVQETLTVSARVLDQHGTAFTEIPEGLSVTWLSSDNSIATVDGGIITGIIPGQAIVTAQADGLPTVQVSVEVQARLLNGQLEFDFDGDRTGTFAVSSTFRVLETGPDQDEWVVIFFDTDFGSQDFLAFRTREDNLSDLIWFWVDGQVTTPGAREADAGVFVVGITQSGDVWDDLYEVTSGTVDFAGVTTTRMNGSFELALENEDEIELNVTNGSFDAPIITDAELGIESGATAVSPAAAGIALEGTPLSGPSVQELLRRFRSGR